MKQLLTGGRVYTPNGFVLADVAVDGGRIVSIARGLDGNGFDPICCDGCSIVSGFADVHVHLREPDFCYKETIATGTAAAAHGGYTAVCSMPNLNPPPDTPAHLQQQLDCIAASAQVKVYPYGCITAGQRGRGALTHMAALAQAGAIAFSDDGRGVQEESVMRAAMEQAAANDLLLAAHCEDESLLTGGCIHDGRYAKEHGYRGICSASEWKQVERDLRLAKETGCRYHICHVSTKETVALVRRAKADGVRVTCETAPHYLLLCEDDLQEDGAFKMNPPLRTAADRQALIAGLLDGTIDLIATDHAPHSTAEKSGGLQGSLMGIVGLETAFPLLYTHLVLTGYLRLERLVELLSVNPRRIFRLGGGLAPGQPADLAVLDLEQRWRIDPGRFLSKGRATPFAGWQVLGQTRLTMVDGNIVYRMGQEENNDEKGMV
ncbi:MAG: dihydroorotase [Angelakisella sp.]